MEKVTLSAFVEASLARLQLALRSAEGANATINVADLRIAVTALEEKVRDGECGGEAYMAAMTNER